MSCDKVQTGHVRDLLSNVHTHLPGQLGDALCQGQYLYYHYGCDKQDDRPLGLLVIDSGLCPLAHLCWDVCGFSAYPCLEPEKRLTVTSARSASQCLLAAQVTVAKGWGCGYRTLQTMCSWVRHHYSASFSSLKSSPVPSIIHVQQALVEMGDKPESFVNSRQWIGSFEACLVLDHLYDTPCKILHIEKGSDTQQFLPELHEHFTTVGAPVMMGGETDNSSKGILGVRLKDPALLVLDPHYFGERPTPEVLMSTGYLKWMPVGELHASTFYNMCLPKVLQR